MTPKLLTQLIIQKYGEEKFATGCQLVAQWVNFATGSTFTQLLFIEYSKKKLAVRFFNDKEVAAIKLLFGNNAVPG